MNRPFFWLGTAVIALCCAQLFGGPFRTGTLSLKVQKRVILEIQLTGKGMIWPTVSGQTFFRLFDTGDFEYQSHQQTEVVLKKDKLRHDLLEEIIRVAETSDFRTSLETYEPLEILRDASLKTTVRYNHKDLSKQVLIINYQPTNPKAGQFYPLGLRELLEKQQK